jgi:HD superfamily phosphohydrolase YqeK
MCPPSSFATTNGTLSEPHANLSDVVPPTKISQAAFQHAASILAPAVLNHSVRVYLYTKALAAQCSSVYSTDTAKHDLLFVACLFHDIGTTSLYDGPQRFEVEGGDAAVQYLTPFGVGETDKHDVWTAIACHTCPGIAERIGELSRLVRIAVATDFGMEIAGGEGLEELRAQLEERFDRADIKKVLTDAIVEQARKQPQKAPRATWPGALYRASPGESGW